MQWISSEIKLKKHHCTRLNPKPYSGAYYISGANTKNNRKYGDPNRDPFLDPQYCLSWQPPSLLSWGGDSWSKCGPLVHICSMWRSCYYLPFQAVAAEVSVNSSVLSCYLSPEQFFVQVLVHCMCILSECDALHSLSLQWSLTWPLGVEFYMQ